MHTSGGFFSHSLHRFRDGGPFRPFGSKHVPKSVLESDKLVGIPYFGGWHKARFFPLLTANDSHGGVTTIIKDHVGEHTITPTKNLVNAPPILGQGFTFPSKNWYTSGVVGGAVFPNHDCGSSLILGGENIT